MPLARGSEKENFTLRCQDAKKSPKSGTQKLPAAIGEYLSRNNSVAKAVTVWK
jgi:hypothetical protein